MSERFELMEGRWSELRGLALPLRTRVFVDEQGVPPELEEDHQDAAAHHIVARSPSGVVVGTGRLTSDGHIGRLAVDRGYRGRGIGSLLLQRLTAAGAERGFRELILNAQLHALAFYQRAGWQADGPVFDDAGIAHRRMHLALPR